MWQLKYNGKLVKEHSSKIVCTIEAMERGWVMRGPSIRDFETDPDLSGRYLICPVTIERKDDDEQSNQDGGAAQEVGRVENG